MIDIQNKTITFVIDYDTIALDIVIKPFGEPDIITARANTIHEAKEKTINELTADEILADYRAVFLYSEALFNTCQKKE